MTKKLIKLLLSCFLGFYSYRGIKNIYLEKEIKIIERK